MYVIERESKSRCWRQKILSSNGNIVAPAIFFSHISHVNSPSWGEYELEARMTHYATPVTYRNPSTCSLAFDVDIKTIYWQEMYNTQVKLHKSYWHKIKNMQTHWFFLLLWNHTGWLRVHSYLGHWPAGMNVGKKVQHSFTYTPMFRHKVTHARTFQSCHRHSECVWIPPVAPSVLILANSRRHKLRNHYGCNMASMLITSLHHFHWKSAIEWHGSRDSLLFTICAGKQHFIQNYEIDSEDTEFLLFSHYVRVL